MWFSKILPLSPPQAAQQQEARTDDVRGQLRDIVALQLIMITWLDFFQDVLYLPLRAGNIININY